MKVEKTELQFKDILAFDGWDIDFEESQRRLTAALTASYEKGKEDQSNTDLVVMSMFVGDKGEDYPLGKYLNLMLAKRPDLSPTPGASSPDNNDTV